MVEKFVKAWDANKVNLEEYFRTHAINLYGSYEALCELLFKLVINPYLKGDNDWDSDTYDTDDITVIDHGNYQGTQLFVLHTCTYQPSAWDYVITFVSYGSCSMCDLLQSIQCGKYDELPDDDQVRDYMQLCLNMLQRAKIPFELE